MSFTSLALSRSGRTSPSARLGAALHAHLALVVAVVTLAFAWSALLLTHRSTHLAVPKAVAIGYALKDQSVASLLGSVPWNRTDVSPMDSSHEMVGFYRGDRMVATVTIGFNGKHVSLDATDLTREKYAFGSNIANDVRMLAMLSVAFMLVTAVWPLWRLRNLDVLVATSTVLAVVLFNRWMLTWMVAVSYPALLYLVARCLGHAARSRHDPAPAVPLYDHLTRQWAPRQRLRVLRLVVFALSLIVAMVGFTSLHVLDVGYAVMEGATQILHGIVPYGHIPDVLHGDTYPIGSYLLYIPFVWFSPVHSAWDNADATLAVAIVAALLIAGGAWWIMRRCYARSSAGSYAEQSASMRAAIAALAFPPLLVTVSTGTTDVVLGAILMIVLLLWRRPVGAGTSLAAAAWFKLAPAVLLPLWLARLRGRQLAGALAAIVLLSSVLLAFVVALGGSAAPVRMLRAISFQFTRSSPHTLWAVVGSVPLQQLAQAATLALIAGACVAIRRDPLLGADLRRLAAFGAAVLICLQISASYWNYMYLVWILPFLLVSILACGPFTSPGVQPELDNLTHRAKPPIPAKNWYGSLKQDSRWA